MKPWHALSDLGIPVSAEEEAAYRFLVAHPGTATAELADALGRSPTGTFPVVDGLRERGLARLDDREGIGRWYALPPQNALVPALGRLSDDLRRTESAVTALLRSRPGELSPVGAEIIDGREAQARQIRELEVGARHTIRAFQTGANSVAPVPDTLEPAEEEQEPAGEPSLPGNPVAGYQVLVDRDFLTEPEAMTALEERVKLGHQVRVVDSPLIKLAIADGELAMVQVSPERSVLLRPPLVLLAVELFEMAWRHSRPYLRDGGDLSPVDRRILQLMLSGLTDAATAHQLGTSPRTVQRRLRALMDAASVTSRVQLGWYAMRNNWV